MWRAALLCLVVVFAGVARSQPPIGPVRPASGLATAYIFNNTNEPIRFFLNSGRAGVTGVVAPGQSWPLTFETVARPRVLNVFSQGKDTLLSSRQVEMTAGNYYLATSEATDKADPGLKEVPKTPKPEPAKPEKPKPEKPKPEFSELPNL